MRGFILVALLALAWLTPAKVDACGATPPSFTLLTDAMNRVPAGTKVLKLYVYGSSIEPTPPKVNFIANGRGVGLPVTIPVTLRVAAPWLLEVDMGDAAIEAGSSYSLTVEGVEHGGGNVGYSALLSFEGVAASPRPSELGQLTLEKRASGRFPVGGCGESAHGEHVLIKLAPSAAAEPWTRAVKHQLFVDGKARFEPEVPLVDHVARKLDPVIRAYARCAPAGVAADVPFELGIELPLEAGEHTVKWASTFADGTTLETPGIAVDLRCSTMTSAPTPPCCKPPVGPNDAGAAVARPDDAGTRVSADAATGAGQQAGPGRSSPPTGASAATSAGSDAAAENAQSDEVELGEAGCSVGGSRRDGWATLVCALTFATLLYRRRR